jgi:thymidylate synthase
MQMLQIPTFPTFQDAYVEVLRHVSEQYEHRPAPRGNAARECLNVSFSLTDPRDRIVYAPARRTNIVFSFAEALWYLWGRDDLEMIAYYAPRLAKFSADGTTLTGSAYGPRMFRPATTGRSQWERVRDLLVSEPGSKRAVLGLFRPEELVNPGNSDVSCTLGLQFMLRSGHLHATAYMRGNDAVIGLLSDVFSFTLIQEFTALQIGAQLGSYAHHVGSMHVGDHDADRAAAIVADADADAEHDRFPVAPMPPTNWSDLHIVQRHEEKLRRDEERLNPYDVSWLGLAPYWQQVLLMFEIYRQIVHHPGDPVTPQALQALAPKGSA